MAIGLQKRKLSSKITQLPSYMYDRIWLATIGACTYIIAFKRMLVKHLFECRDIIVIINKKLLFLTWNGAKYEYLSTAQRYQRG